MRQEPRSPWSSAMDRLQGSWGRARRWLANRGAATRVGLALAGLVAVGLVGYLASGDHATGPASVALYEGQHLSSDDIKAITKVLDDESIKFAADRPAGRVVVRADQKSAALAAINKHKATPTTLDELNRDDEPESVWATPAERERHERDRLQQSLKRQIEGLNNSILSAQVTIHRERARGSWNARWSVHAYVFLKIDGRRLGPQIVDGIETFLVGAVPDLSPGAITVTDQNGYKYMVAGDAPLKEQAKIHSQEDEWQEKIEAALRHIPGVGVSVIQESVAVPTPPVEAPPAASAPEVAVANRSLQVAPEPKPVLAPPPPPMLTNRANVLVRVPRSFYLMAAQGQSPGRHPSAEDLLQMQTTTERVVRETVNVSIPSEKRGDVKVLTVQDDLSATRTAFLSPDPTEPRQAWLIPSVASGAGLAVVAVVVAGFRLAAKRPTPRPGAAWRPGFVADEPNPGPSERVRELIRLNPEAAAGVLQRWIGQGGTVG